jgi:hypothetical protein
MRYRERAEACRAAGSAPPSGIMIGQAITEAPAWRAGPSSLRNGSGQHGRLLGAARLNRSQATIDLAGRAHSVDNLRRGCAALRGAFRNLARPGDDDAGRNGHAGGLRLALEDGASDLR